jgi:hypothetical protein
MKEVILKQLIINAKTMNRENIICIAVIVFAVVPLGSKVLYYPLCARSI